MSEARGHILVVDDTPKNIQVLGSMLREAGYAINVASNGQQALDALARVVPDLILLDVIMPVMDGFETCKRIKANPALAHIPVVFLTAKVEAEDIITGFELGAVDYITKPFNSSELLKRVDTHLSLSKLRSELAANVAELTSALSLIEQLHREQDLFLRHELNNVIGPIAGYAEMLRSQIGHQLDERQQRWLAAILQGTVSMQQMLDQIKKLHDFERGAHALNMMPVALEGILSDVVSDVATYFKGAVPIYFDPAPCQSIRIRADLAFLPGVFKNLIKNAVEHISSLSGPSRRVDVYCSVSENRIAVTVHNGGEAIPSERLATFFDKFNTTKAEQGGTGLGTSYARLVTEAHGGVISVQSSSLQGTLVTVDLPIA
ncbi:hybrid sensor histidine kinase/response regulator [bacterium]|nr:hybrid sensor histidine kinase/response regulator [bacterium]